ncbi:uncharacterized protein N7487_009461 [Penicillium crustosum]|uniref:uncharacterized protein n=1 Tax=Penicillium crustosum TaxID=36656 RepID=UPI0023928C29|nr:uncharacterized protein N7487_009461 [Penicillium crustosum]KAJ5395158.1 hypothetical protein N7487_009461 [Penicillium crustosum]
MAGISEGNFTGNNPGLQIAHNSGLLNANFCSGTGSRISENAVYIRDLQAASPRHDKSRMESYKGRPLKDAYSWVLDNDDFNEWL